FAQAVAGVLAPWLRLEHAVMLPKFEIYLQGARRPVLRASSARWQAAFKALAEEVLAQGGAPDPVEGAGLLVAAVDGLIIDALATADGPPDEERLRAQLRRLVRALLR